MKGNMFMAKEHLTKKQRDNWTSLSIGVIGGAYVLIADKVGTITGLILANDSGIDPTIASAVCSIVFSIIASAVAFYYLKKAGRK